MNQFVCPRCGTASAHPEDLSQRYCGRCHQFVDDGTLLLCWQIYDHPRDHPAHYVAREFFVTEGGSVIATPNMILAEDLDLLRDRLQWELGKLVMPRHPEDHPNMIETWI